MKIIFQLMLCNQLEILASSRIQLNFDTNWIDPRWMDGCVGRRRKKEVTGGVPFEHLEETMINICRQIHGVTKREEKHNKKGYKQYLRVGSGLVFILECFIVLTEEY